MSALTSSAGMRYLLGTGRSGGVGKVNPTIYHITHIDNLPGIIAEECLWSDAQRIVRGFCSTNIGHKHIKERRLRRGVDKAAGGFLGDYVPFNFCNRSVMLYPIWRTHNDYGGGQEPVVHLVTDVETVVKTGRPWFFTDRHAELSYADQFDDLDDLDKIDWEAMETNFYWGGDKERKERRQAEFLVHEACPWECFHQIVVHNRQVAGRVVTILRASDHKPDVRVERGWYY